ncbi:MAG: bifunctional [glutamine synthetase] adenylyltransferase/[glutamine synthetase]-adenylyl-L-tyrosine phosphorylase [Sphingomonadales bacterium]|nr:bifunctional [glutamine synthetase] adenylyltransferase/[glutamine synthetase]-adenylyl-L-tyrosine phosphorylase [Sphingomonadales bacterium]PIX65779.1 MAG: bifunctional [glutamate--ammonia ligase]-adenylyl-L-tyrosine phosphorylase/[glutamate--ammonia-ligase] adenylyltransferase [Sphingomonadales bacterium CG_4_10_14_3_um_filter_58_15]NCO49016.1 bifunctional [glutamine synthetase] adenylyltransferase/[glutamine synthetase]-adenylyl-L-tyrosine phosphorylase [Sphingomonadales bacterium]NCP00827
MNSGLPAKTTLKDALDRASAHAPYLGMAMQVQPELTELLAADNLDAALDYSRSIGESADNVRQKLRREKRALALTLAIGDLAGRLTLTDVITRLSDFADRALDEALADIYATRYPDAPLEGFAVIGLGKHGSRELNYSSDIDPIFIYDPDKIPVRGREEPSDAARRIGQQLVEALNSRDADGYVFRVDMRLRPSPEVSPVALPVEAAISYYESSALAWEQAAYIRSRAAAGDQILGSYFLETINPFIWRRSLDYGAIKNIGSVTAQIRDHYAAGQKFGPGFDLKRGRGGIRETEFYAQMHQLIFGGRQPDLRVPATRDALAALAQAGRIDRDKANVLSESYELYRVIEHRLQMVNDQQTHSLPDTTEALDRVARLHGLNNGQALLGLLAPHVEAVGRIYDDLIEPEDSARLPVDEAKLITLFAEKKLLEADAFVQAIKRWRSGKVTALRSAAAQESFEAILPDLVDVIATAPNSTKALARLDSLIDKLPTAINFFRILEARPGLLEKLGQILSHAPVLADALSRRAELFDGLIDATALDLPPSVAELAEQFARTEPGDDYQMLLDRVRVRVGEKRFALGVQLIEGQHDALEISAGYARVAEAAIQVLTDATIAEFEDVHGKIPGGRLLILALGRLGGAALTHASDLDLIFLFSGDHSAESDGRRPLGGTQYFNRLTARIVTALSVPTAAGPLYEVDTRLRPSGTQGPLAVTLESFGKYQRESAWTWEHMALTRARPVYGDDDLREQLQGQICEILKKDRDPEELRKAVRKMRLDIVEHKPPKGPLDTKLMEGGLVDWEFIIHFLQLKTGEALHPQLGKAVRALVAAGHLGEDMIAAHELMTRLLVALRLMSPDCDFPPETSRALIAKAAGQESWDALLGGYDRARQCVIDEWNRHLRPDPDEILGDII